VKYISITVKNRKLTEHGSSKTFKGNRLLQVVEETDLIITKAKQ
jgi:hypothetical protein